MIRLLPSDPRWPDYDAFQRLLCAVLNRSCHFDAAAWPIDEVSWTAVDRERVIAAVRDEMTAIARTGIE